MDQSNEPMTLSSQEAQPKAKTWSAPTMTTAVLAEITEAGTGGTYTDGSSIYSTS